MRPFPIGITLLAGRKSIEIEWQDGATTRHRLDALRAACPCALCKGHNPAESLNLTPEDFPDVELLDVEVVGRYAFRFTWSDGHDKGIYEFEKLRKLAAQEGPAEASK